jgi:tetrahydromethanopterin S-methyltransferase subunit F
MALVVSTLVDYVIENEDLLVAKSLFGSKTSDLIRSEGTVMTGVKFAEQINILATDAIFQNGEGCTRTSSGTTSITQRKVTVGDIAIVEDICVKTLNKKYLSKALAKGSEQNKLPFEQEYTDLKAATIAKQLEIAIWQGDTNSVDANLSRFDGYIKLIDAAASSVASNAVAYIGTVVTAVAGITTGNVKSVVNSMWLALPADVTGQDDIRIFCGWDTFNKFINAFTDQNLFNFAPAGSEVSAANGVVIIPGTNYKLTAVHGLDGTNRLFAGRMSNFFAGVDLEGEEDQFSIMEDQFKDYLRFKAHFKYGVNVAFPNQIVQFTLA